MTERTLFLEALDRPLAERLAYVEAACRDNPALKARVLDLLAAHEKTGEFLDRPGDAQFTSDAPGRPLPDEDLSFLAPATRPDAIGRLGHYELLEVLGRGGFGIVFRGFDTTLARVVAVKVLHPTLAATSPPRKRFLREAQAAAAVKHEHVTAVYAVEEKPLPYLVMEFVAGQSLQEYLSTTGPLAPDEVVRIARQTAQGLAAAHAKGLIHRDVKPANILLEVALERRIKLTDFGLARAVDDANMTQSGLICGTPQYMSPEQAMGKPLDARSDLFSLGSVMYTIACGRPPFRAEGTLAVLKRVADDSPRPIRDILTDVPDWLCGIIAKLHAKNPADRYASAEELIQALDAGSQNPVPVAPKRWTAAYAGLAGMALLATVAFAAWPVQQPATAVLASGTFEPTANFDPSPAPTAEATSEPTPESTSAPQSTVPPQPPATAARPAEKVVYRVTDYTDVTTGAWFDIVPDAKVFTDLMNQQPKERRTREAAFEDGTISMKHGVIEFTPPATGDCILRAKVRKDVNPAARNIAIRFDLQDGGQVTTGYGGKGYFMLGGAKGKGPWKEIGRTLPSYRDEEAFELALLVTGNKAFTFKDGERVLSAEFDGTLAGGMALVMNDPSGQVNGYFSDVQFQVLPPEAIAPVPKPTTPAEQDEYNRLAVKAVRRVGGYVCLDGSPNAWQGPLPTEPFRITKFSASNVKEFKSIRPFEALRWCGDLEEITLHSSEVCDSDLEWIDQCPKLTKVNLTHTRLTGRTLARLKNANDLKDLLCWAIHFKNDDLKPLAGKGLTNVDFCSYDFSDGVAETIKTWKDLKYLRLVHSKMTDSFLSHAESWPNLEKLWIYCNWKLTDRGLEHLLKCPKLSELHLGENSITDAGLETLARIPTLKKLNVMKTKVTEAGVAKFKAARPDCTLEWKTE